MLSGTLIQLSYMYMYTCSSAHSARQLTQCNNACNAPWHWHEITSMPGQNINFYNTRVLKFAMFCSFHNNCSKIFYFYRLFFDEFVTEITKFFLHYWLRVAWNWYYKWSRFITEPSQDCRFCIYFSIWKYRWCFSTR